MVEFWFIYCQSSASKVSVRCLTRRLVHEAGLKVTFHPEKIQLLMSLNILKGNVLNVKEPHQLYRCGSMTFLLTIQYRNHTVNTQYIPLIGK